MRERLRRRVRLRRGRWEGRSNNCVVGQPRPAGARTALRRGQTPQAGVAAKGDATRATSRAAHSPEVAIAHGPGDDTTTTVRVGVGQPHSEDRRACAALRPPSPAATTSGIVRLERSAYGADVGLNWLDDQLPAVAQVHPTRCGFGRICAKLGRPRRSSDELDRLPLSTTQKSDKGLGFLGESGQLFMAVLVGPARNPSMREAVRLWLPTLRSDMGGPPSWWS